MPQTEADIAAMLETIGAENLDALIAHVPERLRASAAINLAPGRGEAEVAAELSALAAMNAGAAGYASFLGAGYYRHYVPAAVRAITARAEFATSYTPYQAEASQGTTQAIFEFQTLITQLTAMDVANASMYDGASAAAEAVLMARRVMPKRRVVALSRALWPDYRATIRTYLSALDGIETVELPFDNQSGVTDLSALEALAGNALLCTVFGYPNAFGVIEPLRAAAAITHRAGAMMISATAEGLALGLLKPPGELGADIAVGEGQSFGLALQFGGPGLGFMAAHTAHLRQMPGRLVGQTRDRDGRRAFCLTLSTREQHIRRERATSNICTNHSLCALAAAVYLSQMGRKGLRELAERNVELAHAAADALAARAIKRRFSGEFFNEFTIAVPRPAVALQAAERKRILAGVALAPDYPELPDGLLIAVTEMNQPAEFAALADSIAQAAGEQR
ncbi:MAG TPA: aminomethyl-transferring glycine dehydrogenase subunit GcvPA [Candidatus Binataceae bacterium]|nr:aminomethyl-transferring glycine dehydrogenase subunit GcvPA [Candidatus Binataceae bacterium]